MPKNQSPELYSPDHWGPRSHAEARYSIVNDVYIRGKNKAKTLRVHLPALNALLGFENPNWHTQRNEYADDEYRFTLVEALTTKDRSEILSLFLDKLARISGHWDVFVDGTGNAERALYARAIQGFKTYPGPPELCSVMFEIISEQIVETGDDGGFHMSDGSIRYF